MEIWTAFALGLVGSLHCAGMCGPLVLAMGHPAQRPVRFGLTRLGYNLGRITTYCGLGLLFGTIGRSVAVAGFQRWTSLLAGGVILLTLAPASQTRGTQRVYRAVALIKSAFGPLLKQQSITSSFLLGALNGLLPCGLVYVACASAAATSGIVSGLFYMCAFGFGTLPMMLGIGLLGRNLQLTLRFRLQKLIPVCVLLVAALLILRGLSLGIPYLSPVLSGQATHRCH